MKLEINNTHCIEINTGLNYSGQLIISAEIIQANIYSFTDFFFIEPDAAIHLLTEKNEIVSLHSNISNGPARTSRLTEPERTTYKQEIISNIAVVGYNMWSQTDVLKKVHFTVNHSMTLLRHRNKLKKLNRFKYPREDVLSIYDDTADGFRLKARYGAIYNLESDSPKEIWPVFEIEFEIGKTIHEYIKYVNFYVNFMSFCLGAKLRPREIHIDRLSYNEMIDALESEKYFGAHQVHYVWPEDNFDQDDLWVGGSPVRAWDNKELAAFRKCLVSWMDRSQTWKKPYTLMIMSIALKNEMSAERLITACRWFEDIPISRPQNALSSEEVEAIASAASTKAQELGHASAIRGRITNAISWIRSESGEQRFSRLVAIIRTKFGDDILPKNVVPHLTRAMQFRGRTAHGHFEPKDEDEFLAFAKSTRAMEAFCYLLTALELPISAEGIRRLKSNPIIRDYFNT